MGRDSHRHLVVLLPGMVHGKSDYNIVLLFPWVVASVFAFPIIISKDVLSTLINIESCDDFHGY